MFDDTSGAVCRFDLTTEDFTDEECARLGQTYLLDLARPAST